MHLLHDHGQFNSCVMVLRLKLEILLLIGRKNDEMSGEGSLTIAYLNLNIKRFLFLSKKKKRPQNIEYDV